MSCPPSDPQWFPDREAFRAATEAGKAARTADAARVAALPVLRACCEVCDDEVPLTVDAGLRLGPAVNLREGLVCPGCGLNQRQRALYANAARVPAQRVYVLERLTAFYNALAKRFPGLVGSEYVDASLAPGTPVSRAGVVFGHEDVAQLSFADASFDLIVHGDVFEHIAAYRAGFAELARVLRPGGTMLFTVPFLENRRKHEVRAAYEDGALRHLLAPEVHANPIDPAGSLVFQTFGWSILDDLREAGFATAEIGLAHDVRCGYLPSNSPYTNAIEAVLFRATRGR